MVPVCGQRDGLRPEPGSGGLMGSGAGGVPTAIPFLLLGAKGWRMSRAENTVLGDCPALIFQS